MKKYLEIKRSEPILEGCFYAFNNKQFEKGIAEHKLEGTKIYQAYAGLYGSKEGIEKLEKFYEERAIKIKNECNPQEVYDYEFDNHECSYTHDDSEAYEIVKYYFGKDVQIKRKYYEAE